MLEFLINIGASINIPNYIGITALMVAVMLCHLDSFNLLLANNPKINIQDKDGKTALIHGNNLLESVSKNLTY